MIIIIIDGLHTGDLGYLSRKIFLSDIKGKEVVILTASLGNRPGWCGIARIKDQGNWYKVKGLPTPDAARQRPACVTRAAFILRSNARFHLRR